MRETGITRTLKSSGSEKDNMDAISFGMAAGSALLGAGVTWGTFSSRVSTMEREIERLRKAMHDTRETFGNRLVALEISEEKRSSR